MRYRDNTETNGEKTKAEENKKYLVFGNEKEVEKNENKNKPTSNPNSTRTLRINKKGNGRIHIC